MHARSPFNRKFGTVIIAGENRVIVNVPISLMKDVVQPYYEERVTIWGYKKDDKIFLEDIKLEAET